MGKKIVVIGSSNTDMIIKLPRIPKPGETILGGEFAIAAGGKGANQAVAAARAGGEILLIVRVGDDIFGNQAIKGFIQDGIDVRHVYKDPHAPSGVALIFVAENGENSIGVASGANGLLSPLDIQSAETSLSDAKIMVMQLEIPIDTVKTAIQLAAKKKIPVLLNPAPAQPLPDDILRQVSILTPNESEAELLTSIPVTDEAGAKAAADHLRKKGVETVIITLGSKGVWLSDKEGSGLLPGFKVKAVDTTAAGDVFNGALATALVENKSMREAVRFANAAAALSVTKLGAQPSAPKRKEIEEFITQAG